jgi:hypothetical protein
VPEPIVGVSSWPIAVLSCPPQFTSDWVGTLDREVRALFARRERFALITDTSAVASIPGARERKQLAEWAQQPEQLALQKKWNVGSSTIVKNAMIRGSLQALYWFWTPGCPQHAARDFHDAWTWCLKQAESAGLAMRPAAELEALALAELRQRRSTSPELGA